MRMLLLAAAVALAALAAVVVVGVAVVGEDEPTWSERAGAACERGLADARAAVEAGETVDGAEQRALQVYAAATEIESRVLADLQALPRPADDELAIERTLAIVSESHRADVVAVERLRRDFDAELLEQRVNDTIPILVGLRERFRSLGADGCVRYYDPESYR
ncbi:MAG: hypothetical protein ACRDNB_07260 [Gaiellaceae bacterium]